jgi:uncharacterized membrane protein YfcA
MSVDVHVVLAGAIVGLVVGMTGMGGGALMTPILVLLFRVQPLAAVASDLVASFLMKPIGAAVHIRRGTVHRDIAIWLTVGSVPSAFAGVLLLRALGRGHQIQNVVQFGLGAALVLAALAMSLKAVLAVRHRARTRGSTGPAAPAPVRVRPLPTVALGAAGGLVVGMTSVGSGSLIIVFLLFLYPRLHARELVGTDLVQAIPLVGSAALGHVLFGDFRFGLTVSLLIGSVPGVYLGAQLSAHARSSVIRPILVFVLLASGLKLVQLTNLQLGLALLTVALTGPPLWAFVRATDGLMVRRAPTTDLPA